MPLPLLAIVAPSLGTLLVHMVVTHVAQQVVVHVVKKAFFEKKPDQPTAPKGAS